MKMAYLEASLLTALILKNFTLRVTKGHVVELKPGNWLIQFGYLILISLCHSIIAITLPAKFGMKMDVLDREH